jgi:hypothetical protein
MLPAASCAGSVQALIAVISLARLWPRVWLSVVEPPVFST